MLSGKEREVLHLIDENKEEIVEYLRKLVSFRAVIPPSGGKAESDEYKNSRISFTGLC
ncbi:MAG: hypothetical protein J7L19_05355 [Dehalococcoidia bacterium]|nr:hypothetical protein [Dehalococcoidia bacterium]